MKRALVLDGGGNVGIAREIAVLAALREGGVDAREADVVIGTSAGSVVGTHIAPVVGRRTKVIAARSIRCGVR